MPLRDHFRPPTNLKSSWEELHGQWPATIVQHLRTTLPPGFTAAPRVHLGAQMEIDIATYDHDQATPFSTPRSEGGVATALWTAREPSVAVETTLPDFDEYEVRVYDATRNRRLVAAIEIVSPANKDRIEHRHGFVAKCAALLQQGVAVSIVDLVTVRQHNLYLELMDFIGHADTTLGTEPPCTYATSCRWIRKGKRTILESWSHRLTVGQVLPTLPLWLSDVQVIPLDLEASYEHACRDLWIA